jgi:hypothetical protein
MGKYPYILNTGSLKKFLDSIPKMGTPQRITQPNLPSMGFKSSADRPIVSILRFIDFINENNEPTQKYRDFKTSKAGAIMASALKKSYSDLFEIYPDACNKADTALKDFFAPTTDAGEQVVEQTASTFKVLCSFANFNATVIEESAEESEAGQKKEKENKGLNTQPPSGVNLNVNIQLSLPITDDASVYDKIFKAIRDNLVSRD